MTAHNILATMQRNGAPFEIVCSATEREWWLAEREELLRQGFATASTVGMLLDCSPYGGPYTAWARATGMQADTMDDTDRLRLGREMEVAIGCEVARRMQVELGVPVEVVHAPVMLKSTRYPLCCTLDYLVRITGAMKPCADDGLFWEEVGWLPLEIKTWQPWQRKQWADGPPAHIAAQALTQALVLGVEHAVVGVALGFDDIKYTWPALCVEDDYPEYSDSRTWGDAIEEAASFHQIGVYRHEAPTPTAADLEAVARNDDPIDETLMLTGDGIIEAVDVYLVASEIAAEQAKRAQQAQARIVAAMGRFTRVVIPDGTTIKRRMRGGKPCANGAIIIYLPE